MSTLGGMNHAKCCCCCCSWTTAKFAWSCAQNQYTKWRRHSLAWFGAPINPLTRHLNLHTCESIYLMGECVVCALRWCLYWGPYAHVNLASKHVPCRQNKHKYTVHGTDPVWQQRCEWQCEYDECAYLAVPHSAITGTSTEPNYSVLPLQATNNLTAWKADILTYSLLWWLNYLCKSSSHYCHQFESNVLQ